MFMTCATLLNAQNPTEEIKITGTLINTPTSVDTYRIQVRLAGKDDRLLEEVKPEDNGSFVVTVFSERPVRLIVIDQDKNTVFRRSFFSTPDSNKLELKEIDLSKEKTK